MKIASRWKIAAGAIQNVVESKVNERRIKITLTPERTAERSTGMLRIFFITT